VVDNDADPDSLSAVVGGVVFVGALFLEKKRNLSLGLVGSGGEVGTAASSSA